MVGKAEASATLTVHGEFKHIRLVDSCSEFMPTSVESDALQS